MAEHVLQLPEGIKRNGRVHALIMRELPAGESIVSFRYNQRNGRTNVTTRAFEPFGNLDPESDQSKLVNQIIEDFRAQSGSLERDRRQLDAREANALRRERGLDDREKGIANKEQQLEGERKELKRQRDQLRKGKTTAVGRLTSFFHRQK